MRCTVRPRDAARPVVRGGRHPDLPPVSWSFPPKKKPHLFCFFFVFVQMFDWHFVTHYTGGTPPPTCTAPCGPQSAPRGSSPRQAAAAASAAARGGAAGAGGPLDARRLSSARPPPRLAPPWKRRRLLGWWWRTSEPEGSCACFHSSRPVFFFWPPTRMACFSEPPTEYLFFCVCIGETDTHAMPDDMVAPRLFFMPSSLCGIGYSDISATASPSNQPNTVPNRASGMR